jgi:hypothetical protein
MRGDLLFYRLSSTNQRGRAIATLLQLLASSPFLHSRSVRGHWGLHSSKMDWDTIKS